MPRSSSMTSEALRGLAGLYTSLDNINLCARPFNCDLGLTLELEFASQTLKISKPPTMPCPWTQAEHRQLKLPDTASIVLCSKGPNLKKMIASI